MISRLGRREFMIGTLWMGALPMFKFLDHPTPRVYKLVQWRSHKKLMELQRAFEFLESASVENKTPGRYAIDEDRIYATVVEDKTRAVETAQFEVHQKYIDVHYLVRGKELIGSANPATLREAKPYSSETEAVLYERPAKYKRLILNPGEFTVFFPGQAHMPGCYTEKSEAIKKVVIKILAQTS